MNIDIANGLIERAGNSMTEEDKKTLLSAAIAADKRIDLIEKVGPLVDDLMLQVEDCHHAEQLINPTMLSEYLKLFQSRLEDKVVGMTFNLLALEFEEAIQKRNDSSIYLSL